MILRVIQPHSKPVTAMKTEVTSMHCAWSATERTHRVNELRLAATHREKRPSVVAVVVIQQVAAHDFVIPARCGLETR
jgi:hypothetical protein